MTAVPNRTATTTVDRRPGTPAPVGPVRADTAAGPSPRLLVLGTILTAIITILTLPGLAYVPIGGLDPSYRAAVHMALDQGVRFGGQIVYTFGPLGFVGSPTAYDPTTYALGIAVALVLQFALVGTIVALLLRAFGSTGPGLALTAVAGYLAARIASRLLQQFALPELLTLLLILACLELLRRARPAPQRGVLAAIAALGAAAALVKFNNGVVPLAAIAVAAIALPTGAEDRAGPWVVGQRLAACVVSALGTFIALWLATGQRFGDIAVFVRDSLAISTGHVEAMAVEEAGRRWEYLAAAVLVGLFAVVVVRATWHQTWPTRIGTWLVLAGYLAAMFRHGFVRHDGGHAPLFFIPLMVLTLAWLPRGWRALNEVTAAAAAAVAFAVLAGAIPITPRWSQIREVGQAIVAVAPSRQAEVVAEARQRLRGEYGLSGETVAMLRGRTVHVEPWETALLWAYPELRWGTVPLFQAIVAYTEELDERNADTLSSPDAPEFVLQEVASLDGHNPLFESPAHMLALVCHYEHVTLDGRWQVLRRVPDRCGEPEPVGTEELSYGEWSAPPAAGPGAITVARFEDLDSQPGDAIRGLLLKPRTVTFRGDREDPNQTWRFVQGHAANPHMVALPDCLGWDERFLWSQPYEELTLHPTGNPDPDHAGGFTVTYERIPFACST